MTRPPQIIPARRAPSLAASALLLATSAMSAGAQATATPTSAPTSAQAPAPAPTSARPGAPAPRPTVSRTDLQRHDLSTPNHEAIQTRVDFAPGAIAPRHRHPGEEIVFVLRGTIEYR